jgi:protocatechuate 3,4-dioxygenase beta subunit
MKKKVFVFSMLVCIIGVFTSLKSQAQAVVITGIVVDSDSLYSVSGVYVYLLDANQKMVSKTITNQKGLFTFTNVSLGSYKIRTAAAGYKIMISKKFEVLASQLKYNYKIKIVNLDKGDVDLSTEIDYNEYMDLLEDREVLGDDK